jgi:hypothetical protein
MMRTWLTSSLVDIIGDAHSLVRSGVWKRRTQSSMCRWRRCDVWYVAGVMRPEKRLACRQCPSQRYYSVTNKPRVLLRDWKSCYRSKLAQGLKMRQKSLIDGERIYRLVLSLQFRGLLWKSQAKLCRSIRLPYVRARPKK